MKRIWRNPQWNYRNITDFSGNVPTSRNWSLDGNQLCQRVRVQQRQASSSLTRSAIYSVVGEEGNDTGLLAVTTNGIFHPQSYVTLCHKRRLSTNTDGSNTATKDRGTTTKQTMKVHNTMTGCLESIPGLPSDTNSTTPTSEPKLGLGWYTCGPTTYAPAHLGHARTYVCLDILRRVIEASSRRGVSSSSCKSASPLFVLNITDVDDKILAAAEETGEDPLQLARRYEREFWRDWDSLNCLRPHIVTRVTEHVDSDIVPFIERLVDQGMAYQLVVNGESNDDDDTVNTGGVYFDVRAYNEKLGHVTKYGKLAPPAASQGMEDIFRNKLQDVTPDTEESGPRTKKRDPRDFVLWKARTPGQEALSWPSPWGHGRPGWHIECSAMIESVQEQFRDSHKFLVHAGGIDLKFPHHTNEIAQSEAYLGTGDWIPHWIHTGHLHIDGLKMSKSLKNFVSIEDFLNNNVDCETIPSEDSDAATEALDSGLDSPSDDFRLWCLGLSGSYRGPATFSMARIQEARVVRQKILRFLVEGEAWIRNVDRAEETSLGASKQWHEEECDFFKITDAAKRRGMLALENDLDGSTFVSELFSITEHGMKYIQRDKKGPVEPLISAIREVRELLRLVGFTEATTEAGVAQRGDFRSSRSSNASQLVCGESLVDQLVQFRSMVRNTALDDPSAPGMQKILALSDELRDSTLPDLGVQLIDSSGTKDRDDTWKFCLPRKPSQKPGNASKETDGTSSINASSVDLSLIPIVDFFKVGQYEGAFLEYNENGIPTHNADGSEVSKRLLKKLLKKREKHRMRLETIDE